MKRSQKAEIIEQLITTIDNNHLYITDSQGLNVKQINQIRKDCHEKDIRFQVIKNTLLKEAFKKLFKDAPQHIEFGKKIFTGFTSLFITPDKASEPAKIIQKFHEENGSKKPLLKGALIYGEPFTGSQHLEALSKLKSKEELLAEIVTLLQSPLQNVLSALKSSNHTLLGLVETLQNKS